VQADGLQDSLSKQRGERRREREGGGQGGERERDDKAKRSRPECTKKKKYTRNKAKMEDNNPSNYL